MHPKKRLLILISLLGGFAVLGSYVVGLMHPNATQILWGRVPEVIRPFYTAGMLAGAAGYFAFTYFIFFRLSPSDTRVAGRFGFGLFSVLYTAVLIPSTLWMPLTILAVEQSSPALLWLVRMVLIAVGLASLGLFFAILKVAPRQPLWAHRFALIGSIAFCIQTVLLDATVWVAYFRL